MNFLVGWALDNGRLPSEALELYRQNPRDFKLLMAYQSYRAIREQEEHQKAEKEAKRRSKK